MPRSLKIASACSLAAVVITIGAFHLALLFGGDAVIDTLVSY